MKALSGATLAGCGAILLWGLLALFTAAADGVPPFQLTAMTFAIGGFAGLAIVLARGRANLLKASPAAWAVGTGGLFLYHAVYFAALKLAPPAEASLIAYLWPLLIVLFSALLPGEKLLPKHIAGALLGFAGVAALGLGKSGFGFKPEYLAGYALAFACAFIWSGYSVLSRRLAEVPTEAVAGFCLATAALSAICHLLFESFAWPGSPSTWLAILALGLGPVGAAFFLWDFGVKKGDIRFLGVASYAAPVISTLALIAAGAAEATLALALACGLIAAGAMAAAR